ncbi:adenylate and guanylate cyclase catalytic domain-containing protein [Haematococcus lacustris]
MSKEVEAVQVMNFLNTLYSAYDHLVDKHGVYKLETVGDCYVVVGGLMQKDAEGFVAINRQSIDREAHAMAVLDFALDMMSMASTVVMPHNQQPVVVRCGIHSGPIVSGVVGHRMPKFCCFGDTMNVASRMESTCAKGGIQVSSDTYALLAKHPRVGQLSHSGGVEVKGKGRMGTYLFNFNKANDTAVPVHQLQPSTGAPTKVAGHQNNGLSGPEGLTLDISSSLTFAPDGNSSQALPTLSQYGLLSGSRSPPPSLSGDKPLPGPSASPRGATLTASKGAACEGSSCQPRVFSPYSAVRGSSVRTFAEVMQGMLQANCPGTPANGCNKDRTPAPSRPVLRPRPTTIDAPAPMTSPQQPPSTASARPSSLPSDHELHLRNQLHEASAVPSHLTPLNNMDITATTSSQLSGLSGATAMYLSAASLSATATSGAAGVARLGAPRARLDAQRCQLTALPTYNAVPTAAATAVRPL